MDGSIEILIRASETVSGTGLNRRLRAESSFEERTIVDVLDRLRRAIADRYTVLSELGRGGMATVYLADDTKLDRRVAIKVLKPELAAVLGAERFLREVRITARLEHPHVLGLHDSGEADGLVYYVMPYVEGESLRHRLDREKQLPIDEALQIGREVADALSYAHSHDVIHRDIKPENILLQSGHAVVADFGIARAITAAGGNRLTETGTAIGTPAYMSPEQAAGSEELDGRSDLYSLGCVLYEMLSGEPPYQGATPQAIVAKKLSEPTPRISVVRETVPPWAEATLTKALAKVAADRFATAQQLADALSAPEGRSQPQTTPARRHLARVAIIGATATLVLAAVLWRLFEGGPLTIDTSNIRRVTWDQGPEVNAAISPDGNEVAYVADGLFVRTIADIAGAPAIRLAADLPRGQYFPSWSRDGQFVRYVACTPEAGCRSFEVAKYGGVPRPAAHDVPSLGRAWSPEEDRAVYLRSDSVFFRWFADGEETLLASEVGDAHSFAWSPDGQTIAYVQGNWPWRTPSVNVGPSSIWIVRAQGGEPVRITSDEYLDQSPAWLPDSRHLLFVSNRSGSREVHVIEVSPDGARGEPRPLPGGSNAHSISVAASGRRVAYSRFEVRSNIWSHAIRTASPASPDEMVPVTRGNQLIELHSLSPGGDSIVFDSDLNGTQDIFKKSVNGFDVVPLTRDPADDFGPDWSPDGTEIAFYSTRSGNRDIWVMAADGSRQQQLTRFAGWDSHPSWSPDGNAIVFQSTRSGQYALWVVSRDSTGGRWSEPEQLSDVPCWYPNGWTPDGTSVACERGDTWAIVSRDGQLLLSPNPREYGLAVMSAPALAPDGSGVYFIGIGDDGAWGIWVMPVGGGTARQVLALQDSPLRRSQLGVLHISVGSDAVYLSVRELEADIWVMDLEW